MARKRDQFSRRTLLQAAGVFGVVGITGSLGTGTAAAARKVKAPTAFLPGQPWADTSGATIQAHGGQVLPTKGPDGKTLYYWFGEDRSNGYHDSPGVHVYTSTDLLAWEDKGLALRAMESAEQFDTDPYFVKLYAGYTAEQRAAVFRDLGTKKVSETVNPAILERPKVIHNARTGKWVMWVHADGPSATSNAQYAKANAGVAVADSPTGPYRWIDSYRLHVAPEGEENYQPDNPGMARDMNLFVDDDGTGYIIYSSEENYSLFISRLDADYTYLATAPEQAVKGVDFIRPYIGAHREAPALFKSGATYYLITSGATGWDPNPARYATATDILGEWTDHGNPVQGDGADTTHGSQSTCVIPVDAATGRFIYMGDRWTPSDLANAPYVWLPLKFGEGTSMSLPWVDEWTLDDLTAQQPYTVDADMPGHVVLGDASALPTQVRVTSGGDTITSRVTWETAALAQPGLRRVTGTLTGFGNRTFDRTVLAVPQRMRYVVNCGGQETSDWTDMVAVAGGALLNTAADQPKGADTTWGWTSEGSLPRAGGDLYESLRYAVEHRDLGYEFGGLDPQRRYTVHAGYFDPWPWANRAARVAVNGTAVEEQRLFTATPEAGAYRAIAPDADGKVTLTLTPTRSPDIQLSWVIVAEEG